MGINPDFRDLFSELNVAEARYLVIGAHAVIYYAVPRYTKDVDIWIEPSPDNARRVFEALSRFGAPMESLTVEDLQAPGTVFQIGVEPNRVDVLTSVEGLDFAQAWEKRETSSYGELPISILGLEDLIACKRRALRRLPLKRQHQLRALRRGRAELLAWVRQKGIETVGQPISAGYDPPFTPAFLRRNEVLIRLAG